MAENPATEILDATYRALCKHGYANLTLQDIAAESDKSKSLIHYHYDSKDHLFVAVLDELYERFTDRVAAIDGSTPHERLDSLLQVLLTTEADPSLKELRTAVLELQAQAPYNSTLQERLTEFDEYLVEQLREILTAGVDADEFTEDIDPARDAEFLTTTITGAHTRQVAIDQSSDRLYATMTRYTERHLLSDDSESER